MPEVKKVVIIGPESTGKSTLCRQLAEHFNTLWCPEFAREYLVQNGTSYTYEDLLKIAKGQLALEDEYLKKMSRRESGVGKEAGAGSREPGTINYKLQTTNLPTGQAGYKPLFIDTNMYVMEVWCEFVFNRCHQLIIDEIVSRPYDLYLLMDIDLPWTKDDLREYPDYESREKLYHIYKDILVNQHVPWVNINGTKEERVHRAIHSVERLLPDVVS